MTPPSWDDKNLAATLVTCSRPHCQRTVYATHPFDPYVCMECR